MSLSPSKKLLQLSLTPEQILNDYRIGWESRQASLLGRREVLTGKAKFGIFGDGKEIPQLAMAHAFRNGDWRSGYYRDQTFMLATGMVGLEELFAQLYGDTDPLANPSNGGRLMNNHFASKCLDSEGLWKDLTRQKNTAADTSPTASQMPRLLGLALASKLYRLPENEAIRKQFSVNGDEVAFGTIGDASAAEGHFFETINAAGVLEIPMAISIWDDGWGISVPGHYQITKNSISEVLKGFQKKGKSNGYRIYKESAWNYAGLVELYLTAIDQMRKEHIPAIFHITDCTQPQGHSTSGSHERYKTKEQLEQEKQSDGLLHMRAWILEQELATAIQLDEIEKEAQKRVREARKNAWNNFQEPLKTKKKEFLSVVKNSDCNCSQARQINHLKERLERMDEPIRKDILSTGKQMLRLVCNQCSQPGNSLRTNMSSWLRQELEEGKKRYNTRLYCDSTQDFLNKPATAAVYEAESPQVPGREIIRDNFDRLFGKYPNLIAFGEDVGKIGGVNQTYEGLQEKYGSHRITDTGIREATIVGQGIGLAMRGFRPIAEIQYFDYLLYGLQPLSDDLATLHYRSNGGQKAPLIVSTRGHRLEGIWHAGSPLSMVINSIRGVHVAVPRNMTQAAGFYNAYLQSDQAVIIIEPLNGYRLYEKKPVNLGEFTSPVGVPEIIHEGTDVTLVTYGSCVRIAEEAVQQLANFNISVELIDVQTLIPFDIHHMIAKSVEKTNKVLFFDEDVPGGATSFMMQQVIEKQQAYYHLDMKPKTLTAREHRAAYSSDGDYFSNPNAEDVFEALYQMMHNYQPHKYPLIY